MTSFDNSIRVAACVLNQTALDIEGNLSRINSALEEARLQNAQVICLPELCLTGYGCEDMFLSPGFVSDALDALQQVASQTKKLVVSVGLPVELEGTVYNAAAVLVDGTIAGIVAKQNLARDGLHYEPRWFRPWPAGKTSEVELGGQQIPFGDLVFDLGTVRLGFEICEDAWVDKRPLPSLVGRGVNLILNPSASHFAFGKNETRKTIIRNAIENHKVGYVYANLLGNEAGRAIYDGDAYIGSNGAIIASGSRFSYRDHCLTIADVALAPADKSSASGVVDCDPKWLKASSVNSLSAIQEADWENSESIKQEEFTRSVALGLFDYVRKSRSNGVVVSLSGGADSAAVTCLSRMMLEFACQEIGFSGVQQKLGYINELASSTDLNQWTEAMICTVYQATRNSSVVTKEAAKSVANGCQSTHFELDVDFLVEGYTDLVSQSIGRELNWEQDDITLQNIQARTRSPSIWMFANIRNSLLLSTSNRSEAAVGYATMDGDTSGGLAPIAGIDKAFLREWLLWMEKQGPVGFAAYAFLSQVNSQQPTAELRPSSFQQTDEDDLMPYPVLDFIERAAVRDKLMPRQILDQVENEFADVTRGQAVIWVRRFFQLWCRNQWKRERYAPSFHVDDENLDPKTWCRFPILSGGFRTELQELE